mmetsp:Transcript_27185/g.71319  ORF Transcript_27185/g.71319 Transcript_27185/m.71319 type:complete len:363 (-) Transcript_27185:153-1241(-)
MDGLGGPSGGGGAGVEGNAKWMPDTDVDVCTLCRATRFNVLVRRHHCRFCGAVVCDGCSHGRKYSEAAGEPVRCCDRCIAVRPAPLAPPAASADTDNDGTSGAPTEVTTCEVFENQRNIAGWRKTVPPDRAPFTELGTHREYKYLEAVKPPPGFVWDADEWFVRTGPGVDADGWEYAGVRWDSGFIAFSGTYSMLKHATRRRALTRKCRRIEGITWPRAIVGESFSLIPKAVDGAAVACGEPDGGALRVAAAVHGAAQRLRCCNIDPTTGYALFEAERAPGYYLTLQPDGAGGGSVVLAPRDVPAARFKACDQDGVWFRLRVEVDQVCLGRRALTVLSTRPGARLGLSDGGGDDSLWRLGFA